MNPLNCQRCHGLMREDYGAPYAEIACWNCGARVYPAVIETPPVTDEERARMVEESTAEGRRHSLDHLRKPGTGLYARKPNPLVRRALALYQQGVGRTAIAAQLDLSPSTVHRWIRQVERLPVAP